MKFSSKEERNNWLKETANAIWRMESDRRRAILNQDYKKAFSLLKGIKFARAEFAKVANRMRKEDICRK